MNGTLDKRTKWCYCIGATGRDAAYALISMYLILYVQYTMNLTGVQFAAISAAMIVCMVWDAVNDLLMGIIIENTNFKMGKFKPWILIGAISNAVIIVCLFTIRPSGWGFVAFYSLFYLLWGMTYTMNDISYWGALPTFSSDPKVRDSLVSVMSVFICMGQFAVAGIVPIVIAGNAVSAYRTVALVVGLGLIAFQMLTAFGIRERGRTEREDKLSLKDMYRIFARNDQLVAAGIANIFFNIAFNLLIVFGVNFFYIEFGYSESGDLVFVFTVMYGLGMLISQASYASVAKHFKREQILRACFIGLMIGYAAFFSFGYVLPRNIILLNAIGFLIFFFQGLMNATLVVMINNTIEYDEARFGERHDSVISAVRSFSVKLAGGLNQGLSTLVLIASGIYAKTSRISALEIDVSRGDITKETALASANGYLADVTSMQRLLFRAGMIGIPVAAIIISYLILRKRYHIDEAEYGKLISHG
ncbi:MAG: glycoside-pentoside-hexuronide (GPH):cation symporter [Lachnospiraceae bacterium]|nr:glycoside-pentoside-hexuronide (GPH):cation symporter [Lachnospiraceae bacterium]